MSLRGADPVEVSPARARRRVGILIIFTALSLIAGLVFVAVRADGRELSHTTSNDGGAWLVNRSISAVAHRNRATGELSSYIRVTDSPTADVHQSGDLVVVHDTASNQLYEVDTRSFVEDLEPTQLPEFTSVLAVDDAVIVMRTEPLAVWRIERGQLPGVLSLDEIAPLVQADGPGKVAASPDGRIVVFDSDTGELYWITAAGVVGDPVVVDIESDAVDLTIVEASAVVLNADGDLFAVGPDQVEHTVRWSEQSATAQLPAKLQQSSVTTDSFGPRPATSVALITTDGEMMHVTLSNAGNDVQRVGSIPGAGSVAPIVHNGCIYGVVTSPPTYGVACGGFSRDDFFSQPLAGAGQNLRLRLVNGWVWVNDVDTGTAYSTDENHDFQQFDDWGPAQEIVEDEDPEEQNSADDAADLDGPLTEDPDADGSVQDSDDFDPSEANVPPVAVDDFARTRVDRSVVVDVLANDTDANNDILVVTSAELISGSARVSVTPSGAGVQVTPGAGFVGPVQLRYAISDGKSDPVSALVSVDVLPAEEANRPPIAVTDVIATAPGHTTTVDVLRNDSDPDGDAIALAGIESPTGTLRWDPIGQVTFTPDNTTEAGWIELPYVVVDDLGADTEGLLRVEIRDEGANQEPDARNDQATTVVGRAVVINLLANDSDPDGDPLIVGSQPRLIEPEDAIVQSSTTSDGEFVFRSDTPGTFLFSYTVNDASDSGSESDSARIRIDVLPAVDNKPPVAVRDDAVIAVGETRTVYALANDGDPDGDVVSIVDWQASGGLQVTEFNDGTGHVGFQVTVEPGPISQPTMTYWISDGVNDPVSAPIVVAVVQRTTSNQPPFANDDVIEARAGSTITGVRVLANDFDPEAGPLRVQRVGDAESAVISIGADQQSIDLEIAANAVSSFTVPYDIEDDAGNRDAAVLRVQLINADARNRLPTARTDDARTRQGEAILIDVLSNDSDPDSDVIALEAINAQPSHGVAEITAQGAVRYQPDADFSGTDVLRYSIIDSQGGRGIGDVFVGVQEATAANLPPVANDDSYTLAGTPSTTPLDVLANDFDPEGDPLRVIEVTSPSHGFVVVDEFGRVEYQPPASLSEAVVVTFDYVIVDTANNPDRATVSVSLEAFEAEPEPTPEGEPGAATTPTPVATATAEVVVTPTPTPTPIPDDLENEPPIAVNDERGPVRAGTEVIVDVLENDRDPDAEPGEELAIVAVGADGTISGNSVVIVVGEETVSVPYTIEDVDGDTDSATITVLVIENEGPTVTPLDVVTQYETAISIDVAAQAVDPDEDDLFFVCCENIRGGAISNVATSANAFSLVFTPDDNFIGQAGFAYRVDDQKGHQVSGSVTVNVADPDNRAPETIADTVLIPQRESVSVDLAALTSDPDDDELTYTLLSQPGGGVTVQLSGSSAVVSVDSGAAIGAAGAFTYQVSDGTLTSEGTVSIEISEGANRPPVMNDYAEDLPANSSTTILLDALSVELDPGDSLTYTEPGAGGGAANVGFTLSGSVMQVNAASSAVGRVVPIQITATDSRGASDTGTITITVTSPTAPLPSTTDDTGSAERNGSVEIDVAANDADPLGQGLTLTEVDAQWGTATIIANELRFLPGDRVGTSIVTYTVIDAANRPAIGRATIETIGAPDQPSPPDATRGSTEVALTWDEPADNGRDIEGYRIFSSEGGPPEVVGRQNSFTWTGLDNGTPYTFTVVAFNSVGDSLPSDPSPEVTPDEVPEAPAPPTAVRGDGELDVTWGEPTNLGTSIDRYEVQIGPLQVPPVPVVGSRSHTWEGLTNGNFYTFTVRAHNDAGWSAWSSASEEVRPSAPPAALTIGTTTRGTQSGSLTVNWSNNAVNGAPITEYEILSSAIAQPVPESDPNARSYDWSQLPNGVDMSFQVRALNEAGWSAWSASSNIEQACGVPSAPTNVVPVRGNTTVDLTWTAPADTQVCGVQGYIVRAWQAGSVVFTQNNSNTTHEFTGLTNGQLYSFTVTPTNVIGTGAESAETVQVRPAGPPVCSSSAAFTASLTAPRAIDLSWSSLAANNGEPITDYEIDQGTGYQPLGSNAENTTISPLANGTRYDFDIRAVNVVGVSGPCASTFATTWALPTNVTVNASYDSASESLRVGATDSDDGWGVPPGWSQTVTVYRDGSEIALNIVAGAVVSGTYTWVYELTLDGTYRADFESCNAAGCVLRSSAPVVVTLPAPPAQMTAAQIVLSSRAVTNVYGDRPGMHIDVTISPPADNGAELIDYETEIFWSGSSGTQHPGPTNTTNVSSNPSQTFTIDSAQVYRGYSTHAQGRNGAETYTWQVRSRARNAKGWGDWSDYFTISPPPPSPTLDFTITSVRNCTPENVSYTIQCHEINVEMYGFPRNRTYDFRSPKWPNDVYTTNAAPQWQQDWPGNGLAIPDWPDDCQASVLTTTDAFGIVAGNPENCLSQLGAQVRLSSNDGYYSPWYPGA